MKLPLILLTLICCAIPTCGPKDLRPKSLHFVAVNDASMKSRLEKDWILGKTWKLTPYYPDHATRMRVEQVIEVQSIDRTTVKDMFYYTRPGGDHLMFLACVERDGTPRSHCIGFHKSGRIAVYWIQTYPNDKKPEYDSIAVPGTRTSPPS